MQMKKEELISALGALGYRLLTKENDRLNNGKVLDVFDELSGSLLLSPHLLLLVPFTGSREWSIRVQPSDQRPPQC